MKSSGVVAGVTHVAARHTKEQQWLGQRNEDDREPDEKVHEKRLVTWAAGDGTWDGIQDENTSVVDNYYCVGPLEYKSRASTYRSYC